jgi:hypothetical protein
MGNFKKKKNMKKQIQLIVILLISTLTVSGQSLYSLRDEIKDKYTLKAGIPVKIVETIKDYKYKGIVSKEETIDFSRNGKSITTCRYDKGDMEMYRIREYNENNLKTGDILKRKMGDKGWLTCKSTYYYGKKGLFKIITTITTDYSKDYKSTTSIIECDSLGIFNDCKIYGWDKTPIIHETGLYDYMNNIWTYSKYDSKGHLKRQEKLAINLFKKYNDKGDVIFYPEDSKENNKIFYRVDYNYDELGNWVEKNIYKLIKEGNEIHNEKLFQTISRQIKYKKTSP